VKLSIFTDEISPDPARAIELAAQWNVPRVELRSLPGGRFPRVPDEELEDFRKRVADAGLLVSGVSPGLFKCPLDDPEVEDGLGRVLPRACEWARRLGTDLVSCFAFRRDSSKSVPPQVIDKVAQMASIAEAHHCRLVLENEAVCWGATGLEAARIIRQADSGNLSLLWDPGNSARAGSSCPYPDEYEQFKDLVTHLHLKNFDPRTGRWSLIERGVVDWPGQWRALRQDGYQGFLVIETHLRISPDEFQVIDHDLEALEASSRRNLEFVRACLDL
jgi:sugar phosphate isomerase/epimerase